LLFFQKEKTVPIFNWLGGLPVALDLMEQVGTNMVFSALLLTVSLRVLIAVSHPALMQTQAG
jgi:hypothetical protein